MSIVRTEAWEVGDLLGGTRPRTPLPLRPLEELDETVPCENVDKLVAARACSSGTSPTTPTTRVRFASLATQQRAQHPEHLMLQGSLRLVLAACLARLESRYAEVPGQ